MIGDNSLRRLAFLEPTLVQSSGKIEALEKIIHW